MLFMNCNTFVLTVLANKHFNHIGDTAVLTVGGFQYLGLAAPRALSAQFSLLAGSSGDLAGDEGESQ